MEKQQECKSTGKYEVKYAKGAVDLEKNARERADLGTLLVALLGVGTHTIVAHVNVFVVGGVLSHGDTLKTLLHVERVY